jgi:hypothetical protein
VVDKFLTTFNTFVQCGPEELLGDKFYTVGAKDTALISDRDVEAGKERKRV